MEQRALSLVAEELAERLWQRIGGLLEQQVRLSAVAGSLKTLLVVTLWRRLNRPVVVVVPSSEEVAEWHYDLAHFAPDAVVRLWSRQPRRLWEQLRHLDEVQLQGVELVSTFLRALAPVAVVAADVVGIPLPHPEEVERRRVTLRLGAEVVPEELLRQLLQHGFQRVETIAAVGDVARRGGILDIFPPGWQEPLRIEFWGNTVESLRRFDPETQRSTARFEQVEFLASFVWESLPAVLWDCLPAETLVVVEQPEQVQRVWAQHGYGDAWQRLQQWQCLILNPLHGESRSLESSGQPSVGRSVTRFVQELQQLAAEGYELFLCAADTTHLRRFQHLVMAALREEGEEASSIAPQLRWVEGAPAGGFLWRAERIAVWTEHELFGRRHRSQPPQRRTGLSLQELQRLKRGDYLVHVDHGIGIFDGLQVLTVGEGRQECVRLLYAEGDVLYVPLNHIHKLQRYEAQEGVKPTLSRLGGRQWQAMKARAKKRLKEAARELIRLYARRKLQPGFAFPPDTLWQQEMEAAFPYEETPDQARATAEVKADMEAPTPMDRLICGDVGFGKTEIAIRAAFKAVQAGKQVAVLVPTTILAEQHFLSFSERLRPYPVVIATLSRFRTRREQKEILAQLERGQIDIIIGTHRLLSPDVRFHDLGLLIVDEEHRFGVMAKERLRQWKVNVDTLMLTATPIPRTLHMALIGVRDMSLIETPPRNRLPVRTYVVQWDDEFIRCALEAELERGGQVFFVTSHIEGMERLFERLRRLVPQARIQVAHGRLQSRQLESVMEAFLRGEVDILLCTKIVEAGLDFPHANTIFIHHAEKFGLAELYQLRGRVGRSNVQAYCYLIVPPVEQLSIAALRRLQALEEFSELGSGFRLALRDLEIRGAGNLFGPEQSGFIAQMGFELYQQVLEQAIEELRQEEFPELEQRRIPVLQALKNPALILDVPGEAYLPATYIPHDGERFAFYKRFYGADSEAALDDILAELQDRFGALPEPARALSEAVRLRVYLVHTGCVRATLRRHLLRLELPAQRQELFYRYAFPVWVDVVQQWRGAQFVQERQKLVAEFPLEAPEDALRVVRLLWEELVAALNGVELEATVVRHSSVSEEVP